MQSLQTLDADRASGCKSGAGADEAGGGGAAMLLHVSELPGRLQHRHAWEHPWAPGRRRPGPLVLVPGPWSLVPGP